MKYKIKDNNACETNEYFYNKIISHLIDYKENKLGIKENGKLYNYNKKTCEIKFHGEKEWILPIKDGMKNYMCDEAVSISKSITKHPKWNYLNSSETMCINYFAPLIKNDYKGLSKLISSLIHKEVVITNHVFNYVDENDDNVFQFYCVDKDDHKYYFNTYYSIKSGLSKAPTQSPYKTFDSIYRGMLENSSHLQYLLKDDYWKEFMYCHFGIYRNMLMANEEKGDYSFFISLKLNDYSRDKLKRAVSDSCEKIRNFKPIFWESLIITTLNVLKEDSELVNYFNEFKDKYVIYD